jgi:hypothetical protein
MCESGLDVFGYTPTQTTLAHPSPTHVARPCGGLQRKAKAFYKTKFTPPTLVIQLRIF